MTLTLAQMIFSLLFLLILKRLGLIRLVEFDWNIAKQVVPLAFFFNGMVFSGLAPLYFVNVPMYGALRRVTTFLVLFFERYFLQRLIPTDESTSVIFMVFGAMVAGIGDLTFNLVGYILVMVNCVITALYLVYITKTQTETKLDTFGLMFYNNLLCIPFVTVLVFFFEMDDVMKFSQFSDYGFQICFLMSSVQAFLLNYFIFLCSTINSPLTTSITGQLKNIFTTIFGLFLFGDVKISGLLIGGLIISTISSVWYAYIKFQQKRQKDIETSKLKETRDKSINV